MCEVIVETCMKIQAGILKTGDHSVLCELLTAVVSLSAVDDLHMVSASLRG